MIVESGDTARHILMINCWACLEERILTLWPSDSLLPINRGLKLDWLPITLDVISFLPATWVGKVEDISTSLERDNIPNERINIVWGVVVNILWNTVRGVVLVPAIFNVADLEETLDGSLLKRESFCSTMCIWVQKLWSRLIHVGDYRILEQSCCSLEIVEIHHRSELPSRITKFHARATWWDPTLCLTDEQSKGHKDLCFLCKPGALCLTDVVHI
jgi:hypothetical protein